MLARVGDGGVFEPQSQTTRERFGATHPQPDAWPGQIDCIDIDRQPIGAVEVERVDLLAEKHALEPPQGRVAALTVLSLDSASSRASWAGGI